MQTVSLKRGHVTRLLIRTQVPNHTTRLEEEEEEAGEEAEEAIAAACCLIFSLSPCSYFCIHGLAGVPTEVSETQPVFIRANHH
jgi:hypothetical protein